MILYTPMQLELVLADLEKERSQPETIFYDGVPLLIEKMDFKQFRILRILSTDPRDFLRRDISPGTVIEMER